MTTPVTLDPVELPSRYAKALVAIAAAAVSVLVTALTDNAITLTELLAVAIAVVTAVSVYLVPNLPTGAARYAKAGVAVLGAGLQAAVPLVVDGGITPTGWLVILLALLGAVSVGIVPNASTTARRTARILPVDPPAEPTTL
jgi:hypothetical protein